MFKRRTKYDLKWYDEFIYTYSFEWVVWKNPYLQNQQIFKVFLKFDQSTWLFSHKKSSFFSWDKFYSFHFLNDFIGTIYANETVVAISLSNINRNFKQTSRTGHFFYHSFFIYVLFQHFPIIQFGRHTLSLSLNFEYMRTINTSKCQHIKLEYLKVDWSIFFTWFPSTTPILQKTESKSVSSYTFTYI